MRERTLPSIAGAAGYGRHIRGGMRNPSANPSKTFTSETQIIADNTTPAEQRSGIVATYTANAAVRAGALLLQRAAPELATGYMRYYLRSIGATSTMADPSAAFASSFPIPDAIRDAIGRQLDVVLGGI